MSGREREVVLEGGPPWGLRLSGGDTLHALKVEKEGRGRGRDVIILLLVFRSVVSTRAAGQRRG